MEDRGEDEDKERGEKGGGVKDSSAPSRSVDLILKLGREETKCLKVCFLGSSLLESPPPLTSPVGGGAETPGVEVGGANWEVGGV